MWAEEPTSQWVMVHLGWVSRPSLNLTLACNHLEMNHSQFGSHMIIMLKFLKPHLLKSLGRWSSAVDCQYFSQFHGWLTCATVAPSSTCLTWCWVAFGACWWARSTGEACHQLVFIGNIIYYILLVVHRCWVTIHTARGLTGSWFYLVIKSKII